MTAGCTQFELPASRYDGTPAAVRPETVRDRMRKRCSSRLSLHFALLSIASESGSTTTAARCPASAAVTWSTQASYERSSNPPAE